MAIDFSGVQTADNYSTAFVPKLQEGQKGLAVLLDPAYISYTGTPYTGAKRLNAGVMQEFNGTSWVGRSVNGVSWTNGAATASKFSGGLRFEDTRAVNDAPSAKYNQSLTLDFKQVASVANPPVVAGNGYAVVLTAMGWQDASGGSPAQISVGDGLAVRKAVDADTWGPWRTLLHDSNVGTYALPIGGGTLTGSLSAPAATLTGSLGVWTTSNWGVGLQLADIRAVRWAKGPGTYSWAIGKSGDNLYFGCSTADDASAAITYSLYLQQNAAMFNVNVVAPSVQATNFRDANSTANVNLGSGGIEGRGIVAGYSGGWYGGIGYNVRHTVSSGVFVAPLADTLSYLEFNAGGMRLHSAPAGAAGRSVDLSSGSGIKFSVNASGNVTTAGSVAVGKSSANRKLDVAGGAMTSPVAVAFSATPTFDATASNFFTFGNLTGNVTSMAISGAQEGQFLTIRFRQDATGGRTVVLPTGAKVAGSIETGANRASYLNLTYNATDARWEGNWSVIPA